VSLPLLEPWRTSFGVDTSTDSVIVRMVSGGDHGWGEATPLRLPTYGPEYVAGAYLVVRDLLAPLLIGMDVESGHQLQERLSPFRGNNFAKASLDLAWWDLYARQLDQPLWRLIGGTRTDVSVGEAFGIEDDVERLMGRIADAKDRGYARVKLKFGPGSEVAVVRRAREAFPDLVMHIDCNGAYSLSDTAMFRALDELELAMIEQPLAHDDLVDHATLQARTTTPVCLDESITSPRKARQAIGLGSCRWINIKPGRLGGLTPSMEVEKICKETGTPCWIGSMLDSAIATSFGIALASLSAVAYPSDLLPSSRFFERDVTTPGIELAGPATIRLSERSGIGIDPDDDFLETVTEDRAIVE
jgi:O-succinylbenzoate synthase